MLTKIILHENENGTATSNYKEIAGIFNTCFLNNRSAESCSSTTIKEKDSLGEIIKKYELNPSIVKIREIAHFDDKFYLKNLKREDLER